MVVSVVTAEYKFVDGAFVPYCFTMSYEIYGGLLAAIECGKEVCSQEDTAFFRVIDGPQVRVYGADGRFVCSN